MMVNTVKLQPKVKIIQTTNIIQTYYTLGN